MKDTPSNNSFYFDPERFYINKETISEFISEARDHWNQHPFANIHRLDSLDFFELWIDNTSDEDIQDIWRILWKFVNHLQQKNFGGYASTVKELEPLARTQTPNSIMREIFSEELKNGRK